MAGLPLSFPARIRPFSKPPGTYRRDEFISILYQPVWILGKVFCLFTNLSPVCRTEMRVAGNLYCFHFFGIFLGDLNISGTAYPRSLAHCSGKGYLKK